VELIAPLLILIIAGVIKRLSDKSGVDDRSTRNVRLLQRLTGRPGGPDPHQGQQPRQERQAQQQYAAPSPWVAADQPAPRPPYHPVPSPRPSVPAVRTDVDARVRELMAAHNEVGAIRLLCDERDLGILEAQEYARGLALRPGAAPAGGSAAGSGTPDRPRAEAQPIEDETRYVGSAAFATSVFDTDPDENAWASGWVDEPDQDDRSDLDELWQTVRAAGGPRPS
jgi:hypothetical protein